MSFFKTAKNLLGIEIERPPYTVIESIDEVTEIRKYAKTKWVCTSTIGIANDLQSKNSSNMFGKLFKYISGENEQEKKISMTSPVTFDYQSSEADRMKKSSDVKLAMRFYVPSEFYDSPPQPKGDVYIEEDPEMQVAVIRFGGYAKMDDYMTQRDLLISKLGDRAVEYDCVNMMAAGYDPPFKPIGRTNEVWLKKLRQ